MCLHSINQRNIRGDLIVADNGGLDIGHNSLILVPPVRPGLGDHPLKVKKVFGDIHPSMLES